MSNKLDLSIKQPNIGIKDIQEPSSRKYSYEMWIYVFNFEGKDEYIISRESTSTSTDIKNIGIKLDSSAPKLILEYTTKSGNSVPVTITDNFPLQTWVHLIVSVDDIYVDTYMNGKLIKSIQDKDIESPDPNSPIVYGTPKCYLAKLSRSVSPTDPQTAWDKYSAGNGENPMAKYLSSFGLTMTLQKNSQDYSKVTLF